MKPNTHLCLVSAQATPNLTPALDPATAPRRVILLVSPDMERRAQWLAAVLKPRGIRCDLWPIGDAWDLEQVQHRVLELLDREAALIPDRAIALNATGGTKPMSIAAYEAFRAYDLPIFYVHPERDRLIWMHPAGEVAQDLENRLRLEPFLLAHGARVTGGLNTPVSPVRRELASWLVSGVRANAKALGVLNWLAAEAEKTLVSPELDARQRQDQRLQALVDRFAEAGVLQPSSGRLRFPDEEARFYANGGWLEEHVFATLHELRPRVPSIQDLSRSLDIVRETMRGEEIPNEIDVACLAENRLYLFECKTRVWRGPDAGAAGADALYRLDTLTDLLGGLQARAMLVSYRDLPPRVLRRAADLGVRVCVGSRLPELAAELTAWLP
jgi:hypothetical protein